MKFVRALCPFLTATFLFLLLTVEATGQSGACPQQFTLTHTWGGPGSGAGQFFDPVAVTLDLEKNVHVVDRGNRRVQKFTPQGKFLLAYGNEDNRVMLNPSGITLGPRGLLYIADTDQRRILSYGADGMPSGGWNNQDLQAGWRMREPWGIAGVYVADLQQVYVVDRYTCQLLRFRGNGSFVGGWGSSCSSTDYLLSAPQDVAAFVQLDPYDIHLYVADTGNHRIARYDYRLEHRENWGSFGSGAGEFDAPASLAVDSSDCLYVADSQNHRIQVFKEGIHQVTFGEAGQLSNPQGIAVSRADGCVYVADTGNQRVAVYCPVILTSVYLPLLYR